MLDLFRMEVETQAAALNDNLLALETQPDPTEALSALMRAAHSIKGAARIVQVEPAVKVAHVMEDCFVAAQQGSIALSSDQIDSLLQGVDLLLRIAQVPDTDSENWLSAQQAEVEIVVAVIQAMLVQASKVVETDENQRSGQGITVQQKPASIEEKSSALSTQHSAQEEQSPVQRPGRYLRLEETADPHVPNSKSSHSTERGVRVSGENLNRLMGLAGESLVEANWLLPFRDSLQKLRRHQNSLSKDVEKLQVMLADLPLNQRLDSQLNTTHQKANECYQILTERLDELELFARRSANLSDRLYREVIATQMRPFADGVEGFPRMVRDLARQLGKQINFEILGKSTQIDRDILEKLEAPLTHILRNAIDHGIESPEERSRLGKPETGTIRLEARHQAGMLLITASDDGRGVNLEQLRQKVVSKGMVSTKIAEQLTEAELIDFLFLPGFSTANTITEISGRGVGLDIVQSMVQQVGGVLRATSGASRGMNFYLQLPLTLSVIRTLVVEISKEAYAFPLTRIDRLLMVPQTDIFTVENRQFTRIDEQNIGLITAHQVLDLTTNSEQAKLEVFPVVVISDSVQPYSVATSAGNSHDSDNEALAISRSPRSNRYGVVVDRFLGAQDLVVRPLDPRLGKVQDINAAALMEDGSVVLIVDVDDLVRSIDKLLVARELSKIAQTSTTQPKQPLRILVVDDSITVREVERKLLENQGYEVEVAVNGMDAWNAIRINHYDLVITDIDMPRMNGIELVSQIKQNSSLNSLPVIIVSYKDREEDFIRGLDVGANYYLTKSSFHDDTLLEAVIDLIGEGRN
ncbi:hybrid sensor histidine kinase/response regulator [Microcoleus sp. FACHB-SPT15]|nr:hybrid sensor histidine kinase/response regulator [Microcoleus sp. FACHB-SPT15]